MKGEVGTVTPLEEELELLLAFELEGELSGIWAMGRFLTRISFLMRILMPWSANEHDNGVDSSIPGNFLAVYT